MEIVGIWGADTCGCSFFEAVDETTRECRFIIRDEAIILVGLANLQRLTSTLPVSTWQSTYPVATDKLCPAHEALGRVLLRYNTVLAENRRKNICQSIVQNARPLVTAEQYGVAWRFLGDRSLEINATSMGLTTQQKNNVQAQADIQFGPGKVVLI